MSKEDGELFKHYYLETDYSIKEICELMNITSSAVGRWCSLLSISRTKEQSLNAWRAGRRRTNLKLHNSPTYNNIEKQIETNQKRYGTKYSFQSEYIKNKCKQTKLIKHNDENYNNPQKMLETRLEKNGTYATNREKYKQTSLAKWGVENYFAVPGIAKIHKEKEYETRKRNGTFNSSNAEVLLKQYLDENNIQYIYQYKVQNMWFDFLINNSLYLELNGSYWHNYRPFDGSEEHIKEYEQLKQETPQRTNIADKWRYRDTKKLKYCKDNNFNFLVIYFNRFNLNDIIKIINNNQKGINIKILYEYKNSSTTIENIF